MHNSDIPYEKPTIEELIDKLIEIQLGFRQNLSNLHQNLELIDSRSGLQNSLEILKNNAQKKANDLEAEVKQLREDLESIRKFFGLHLDKCNSDKS